MVYKQAWSIKNYRHVWDVSRCHSQPHRYIKQQQQISSFHRKGKLITLEIKSIGMRSLTRRYMDKIDHLIFTNWRHHRKHHINPRGYLIMSTRSARNSSIALGWHALPLLISPSWKKLVDASYTTSRPRDRELRLVETPPQSASAVASSASCRLCGSTVASDQGWALRRDRTKIAMPICHSLDDGAQQS
jgi:hypothetical protein